MINTRLTGLAELDQALRGLPRGEMYRILRNALAAGGRPVRNVAQSRAPVLSKSAKHRTAGLLRDSIKVRTSSRDRAAGMVGVFINVKPAKGAMRGAKSPLDPYYWRWVNFGRKAGMTSRRSSAGAKRTPMAVGAMPRRGFMEAGAAELSAALPIIEQSVGKQVQLMNKRRSG